MFESVFKTWYLRLEDMILFPTSFLQVCAIG